MNFCPNKSHPDWKYTVSQSDEQTAYKLYVLNGFEIPVKDKIDDYFKSVSFNLKATDKIISSLSKINKLWNDKGIPKDVFWKKVQELGIPQSQVNLIKESEGSSFEDKFISFINNYSYTIEINTAKAKRGREKFDDAQMRAAERGEDYFAERDYYDEIEGIEKEEIPTQYHSDLTVSGGTNYTENAIRIPGVVNIISAGGGYHDNQFNQSRGDMAGWFRSDDKVIEGTFSKETKLDDINIEDVPNDFQLGETRFYLQNDDWYMQNEDSTIRMIEVGLGEPEILAAYKSKLSGLNEIDNNLTGENYRVKINTFGIPTKTRRILEVQSFFQKVRDKADLVDKEGIKLNVLNVLKPIEAELIEYINNNELYYYGNNTTILEAKYEKTFDGERIDVKLQGEKGINTETLWLNKKDEEGFKYILPKSLIDKIKIPDVSQNQFLQLLNKDNNWVTFFLRAVIQDSAKKGYEKVLFPTGNTASKVEGHTTLEEFKKQKEDRINELEADNKAYKNVNKLGDSYNLKHKYPNSFEKYVDTEKHLNDILTIKKANQSEINQLKQELERVETEGFGALKPIYNFYENTVTNILKKQGYNPVLITDEYGNTWNEVTINNTRDLAPVLLRRVELGSGIPSDVNTKWLKDKLGMTADNILTVKGLIDNNALGKFMSDGSILLSDMADNATMYHEAFHRVFNMYASESEKQKLFEELKSRENYGRLKSKFQEIYGSTSETLIMEEILAEEFADYILNDKEDNSFFNRLIAFIKSLLNLDVSTSKEMYKRIEAGYYKGKPVVKGYFNEKYRKLELGGVTLTSNEKKDLLSSMDLMFMRKIFLDNPYNFFQGTIKVGEIYKSLLPDIEKGLKSEYLKDKNVRYKELWSGISKGYKELIREHQDRLKAVYGIDLTIDNLEGDIDIDDVTSFENEVQSRNSLDIKASIEFDTKTTMPKVVNMLLGTLAKKDKSGKNVVNKLGLLKQADYPRLKSALINNLWGYTDIVPMLEKMIGMSDKYPEFLDIVEVLTQRNDYTGLKLRNQFTQAFAKTKYNYLLQIIDEKGKIYIMDANSDQLEDKIKAEWRSNFVKRNSGKTPEDIIKLLSEENIEKNPKQIADILGVVYSDIAEYDKNLERLVAVRNAVVKALGKNPDDWSSIYSKPKDSKIPSVGWTQLIQAEAKARDIVDLQIINSDGKTVYGISLNTYQSLVINEINNIIAEYPGYTANGEINQERRRVLEERLPHLFNSYTTNSLWLRRILEEDSLFVNNLFDGSKGEEGSSSIADLKEPDLLTTFFSSLYQGYNMSLKHSDRSMYPTYKWADNWMPVKVFNTETAIERAVPIFKGYLDDAYAGKGLGKDYTFYAENSETPTILGGILTKQEFDEYPSMSDVQIESKIKKYLKDKIAANKQLFSEWKVLDKYDNNYIGIPKEAITEYGDADNYIGVNTVNMIISHIEETKLFTGNPAFYKDADDMFKRLNTQTSTGTIFSVNEENNQYITELNKQDTFKINGKELQYTKFGNPNADGTLTEVVFADMDFISSVIDDIKQMYRTAIKRDIPDISEKDLEDKVKAYSKSYSEYNENDGISFMNIFSLREAMIREGEWDETKHGNVFKEELKVLNGQKAYTIPDNIENKQLEKWFKNNYLPFTQGKYQYTGPNYGMPLNEYKAQEQSKRLNAFSVRKTSYFHLIPSNVKGTSLEVLMNFMLENGVDAVHMFSASKVGSKKTRNMFNSEGEINTAPISPEEQGYLDFRYFKKQVEISPKEKINILSSTQSRKNTIEGTFNNGVPKDVTMDKETWDALSEEDKKKSSDLYSKVQDYQNIQSQIILRNINNFLQSIGAEQMKLTDNSYEALSEILYQAAVERNSPDNIKDAVKKWSEDFFPMETLPNAEKIQNLLNSLITNKILNQKRLGAAMPQAAVTGFEKVQFKDNKVEGSKELEFYSVSYDADGNIIEVYPAKVIMPFPVSWLNKAAAMALSDKSANVERSINGIVDYINSKIDEKNLYFEMKGLRIPNQQLSSNDIFRVKKFSYPQYQQSLIVPSELVAKTGGDFDIDKIQLYMYHTNPQFKPLEMLTEENSTLEKRVEAIIKDPKSLLYLFGKKDAEGIQDYFKAISQAIKDNKDAIEEILISDPEAAMLWQVRKDIKQKLSDIRNWEDSQVRTSRLEKDVLNYTLADVEAQIMYFTLAHDVDLEIQNRVSKELKSKIGKYISELPIELQNTTQALENKLLELETQLILHPTQIKTLLMPVVDEDLQTYVENNLGKKKERKKQYSQILDLDTKIKTYIDFVSAKAGVGQYATWITHLAISQLNGLSINKRLFSGDDIVFTKLPFEGLENNYTMGAIYDLDKKEIAMQLSQLLTSQVDNVKDPYAVALQIVTQTNNTIAYGILRQVPLTKMLKFLSQPIITEYLKLQRINESQIIASTGRKAEYNPEGKQLSKNELVDNLYAKYGQPNEELITDKMLSSKSNQGTVLQAFLNLQDQASAYSKIKNYLSPDTKFFKNLADAKRTVLDLREEIVNIDMVSIDQIDNIVKKGSLLHGFFEGRELYYNLYKDLFLTELPEIERYFEAVKKDYLVSIRGEEAKSKAASLITQEFVNYLLQKHFLKPEDFLRLMKEDSIPKRTLELKNKYPDNTFLSQMVPMLGFSKFSKDGKNFIKFDNMKAFQVKMITDENNLIIEGLDELKTLEPEYVEDLIKYNILQAGTKNGPYQLNKFISYELMRDALTKIQSNPVSAADVADFFPNFISVYQTNLPSKGMAESRGLNFYKYKKEVYYNGNKVLPLGESYKWTDYNRKTKFEIPVSIELDIEITNADVSYKKMEELTNYSGGAKGYDTYWDSEGRKQGVINHNHYTVAYYEKLSEEEKQKYNDMYFKAAKWLGRNIVSENTYAGKLVRRDMIQAEKTKAVFAISEIVAPQIKGRKGYVNKTNHPIIEGGTGYAVASAILQNKPVYVFNQDSSYGFDLGWYEWSSINNTFEKIDTPILTRDYSGIGSSSYETEEGKKAIKDVYIKTKLSLNVDNDSEVLSSKAQSNLNIKNECNQ